MDNKKHIDRLFQEKFKDFEAKPSAKVWDSIENELHKRDNRKTVPIWYYFSGIAIAILLLFSGVLYMNYTPKTNENSSPVLVENKNNTNSNSVYLEEKISNSKSSSENSNDNSITFVSNSESSFTNEEKNNSYNSYNKSSSSSFTNNKTKLNSSLNNLTNKNSNKNNITTSTEEKKSKNKINYSITSINRNKPNSITKGTISKAYYNSTNLSYQKNVNASSVNYDSKSITSKLDDNNFALIGLEKPLVAISLDSLIASKIILRDAISVEAAFAEKEKMERKEQLGSRWVVSAHIAPVYYNSLGKGSQYGDQFTGNNISGETNTSYGVNIGYVLSKKFNIRTGVSKLNLSYDTDNVIVFETVSNTPSVQPMNNIDFYDNNNISVVNGNNLAIQQINSSFNNNAAISQRISYIEIPMELEYNFVKKRFGINIIGGFSTFVLDDNQVVSEFDDFKTEIGRANNINSVSFSTNLGIGLNYNFTKSLKYKLEPTFKYQLNGFSNTSGNFNPYIIGVYTGFSYKF